MSTTGRWTLTEIYGYLQTHSLAGPQMAKRRSESHHDEKNTLSPNLRSILGYPAVNNF